MKHLFLIITLTVVLLAIICGAEYIKKNRDIEMLELEIQRFDVIASVLTE